MYLKPTDNATPKKGFYMIKQILLTALGVVVIGGFLVILFTTYS